MPNYTVIYGNTIFKIKNVSYDSGNTHRVFKRDGEILLSVPLNSILIREEAKAEVQVIPGINPAGGTINRSSTNTNGGTTVINQGSDGDFLLGAVTGFVIGGLFD